MFRSVRSAGSTEDGSRPRAAPSGAQSTPDGASLPALHPETNAEAGPSMQSSVVKPEPSWWQAMMADNWSWTHVRRVTSLGASFGQRRLLVTLEIPSKDRSYPWFLEWMSHQTPSPSAQGGASTGLRAMWKGKAPMSLRSHELAVETTYKQHENGSSEAVFNLVPGPGTHYFRFHGAWFQVKRERDAKLMDLHSGSPWETLTLTTLSSSRHLFSRLLTEARALAEASTEGKTVVYTAWGVEWRPFGKPRRRREMGSVVLADGVAERIEDDLKGFLGRAKWYAERGIPYRRGYLLHGPPGSGKTSFIQALAGSLSYNICLLNLSERGLTDDKLNHLLGLVPERSIVLLEDVDSAFSKREQTTEDGYKSSVTFSGLLNALDGVASSEERVIFMTTNHFERLDPALIRPGRVDLRELIGDAEGEQAKRLFVKFYGPTAADERAGTDDDTATSKSGMHGWRGDAGLSQQDVEELGAQVEDIVDDMTARGRRVSMAALQGLFIRNGPEEAVVQISNLGGAP